MLVKRFIEKVAIVTGGASGIGRATALAFAREGAKVVVADFNLNGANETVKLIEAENGIASAVLVDISKEDQVAAMVKTTLERYGKLDIAFNNAAIDMPGIPLTEVTEANWHKIHDVNLKGTFLCLKHEIKTMIELGGGAIVNTSSLAGIITGHGIGTYTASKHGVVGLTKSAALESIKHGVRINAICPAAVMTPLLMQHMDKPGFEEHVRAQHPIGRWGEPEEIANVVLFLASDHASFIVGQPIIIDGGVTIL